MVQLINRPLVEINPANRQVKFNEPLSFNQIKDELKLLKKSYKDIFEWNIIIKEWSINFISNNTLTNIPMVGDTNITHPGSYK